MSERSVTVDLTQAEAKAVLAALDYILNTGGFVEEFNNQTIKALDRADQKIAKAYVDIPEDT